MSEAGILTAVGLILSTALAFCGGAWAYVNSLKEREAKRQLEHENEQNRRLREIEERERDLRYWLRKQGLRVSRHDEPSPPEVKMHGDSA